MATTPEDINVVDMGTRDIVSSGRPLALGGT